MSDNKKIYDGKLILYPCPAMLVTCGTPETEENVITISWTGILSSSPEYVSIAVRPTRHSYHIIKDNMEFGISIPPYHLVKEVDFCGCTSGRDTDKFLSCHFTKFYTENIKAPLIEQCPMNLECRVEQIIALGVHHLFIGKVLEKYISKDVTDHKDAIAYIRPDYFMLNPEKIWEYGSSVKNKKI